MGSAPGNACHTGCDSPPGWAAWLRSVSTTLMQLERCPPESPWGLSHYDIQVWAMKTGKAWGRAQTARVWIWRHIGCFFASRALVIAPGCIASPASSSHGLEEYREVGKPLHRRPNHSLATDCVFPPNRSLPVAGSPMRPLPRRLKAPGTCMPCGHSFRLKA